jgi:tRNA (cytidine/uridine-2'-O-)-methyltransferase
VEAAAAASYTLEEAELCDRLPHKTAAKPGQCAFLYCRRHRVQAYPGKNHLRLALYQPDIPQNTGALLRLAACLAVEVDLIEPFGFLLGDRRLRRAALDYVAWAGVRRHASWRAFVAERDRRSRLVLLTTSGTVPLHRFDFVADDTLVLGRESAGVPDCVHRAAFARLVIPLAPGARSLNVALAGAIALAEALRQTGGFAQP